MKENIYISEYLKKTSYGKLVYLQLIDKLEMLGYPINKIKNHSNNAWCRDYMPLKTRSGKLVQFRYAPAYIMELKVPENKIPDYKLIHEENNLECEVHDDIILDGGAIEILDNKAIISDRVLRDNCNSQFKKWDKYKLIRKLKDILELENLIVVPQDPYDFTGHVDGLIRFVDKNKVVINDLQGILDLIEAEKAKFKNRNYYFIKLMEQWYFSFLLTLENVGLKAETLPCTAYKTTQGKDRNGIYTNFLKLHNVILMPCYGQEEDNLAEIELARLYNQDVIPINAKELAKQGGMINCVTWTK